MHHLHADIISAADCDELVMIHKALSVIGYRKGVRSLTLQDVLSSATPELIVPFMRARQKVWDKVEELFDLPCQLHVEFTGLISWTAGASLGWHTDDNR